MVAKTSASPAPAADSRAPRRHSPYHVRIACDVCAVAILFAVLALYLAIALLA